MIILMMMTGKERRGSGGRGGRKERGEGEGEGAFESPGNRGTL